MHHTLPSSFPETLVQPRHQPLIELPSSATNMQEYLVVSDDELQSERDSVSTNAIPGPSTPPCNTSTTTPSAPKSSKIAPFDELQETTMIHN